MACLIFPTKKNEASFFLWYTALCVYYAAQCGSTFSKYKQNPMVKPWKWKQLSENFPVTLFYQFYRCWDQRFFLQNLFCGGLDSPCNITQKVNETSHLICNKKQHKAYTMLFKIKLMSLNVQLSKKAIILKTLGTSYRQQLHLVFLIKSKSNMDHWN